MKVLVAYFSVTGNTKKIAELAGTTAAIQDPGAEGDLLIQKLRKNAFAGLLQQTSQVFGLLIIGKRVAFVKRSDLACQLFVATDQITRPGEQGNAGVDGITVLAT